MASGSIGPSGLTLGAPRLALAPALAFTQHFDETDFDDDAWGLPGERLLANEFGVRGTLAGRLRVEGDEAVETFKEIRHVHRDAPKQRQFVRVSLIGPPTKRELRRDYLTPSSAQFPPCGNGFPLRPEAALSRTNCHLELSTSKSRPFCRHIAYLFARRSNGVPEIMPRALNKTVKGTKSAKDCEGEDGTPCHQAMDERRRAHAEGAFEGPDARHQGFEGDEAHGGRSPPQSWYPRRRPRPPPVSFSIFRVLLHSVPLPPSQPCPFGDWF